MNRNFVRVLFCIGMCLSVLCPVAQAMHRSVSCSGSLAALASSAACVQVLEAIQTGVSAITPAPRGPVQTSDRAKTLAAVSSDFAQQEIPVVRDMQKPMICLPITSDVSFSLWAKLCIEHAVEDATILERAYFDETRQKFIQACKVGVIKDWFELPESQGFTDYFYVQKLKLKETDRALFFGDIHGDVQSLLMGLQEFKKRGDLGDDFSLPDGLYLIFLGDYVDRGDYSLEVLYTIFRLKIKNPTQVFVLRGNHENGGVIMTYGRGTLAYELSEKLGIDQQKNGEQYWDALCNLMPVALYLGLPVKIKKQACMAPGDGVLAQADSGAQAVGARDGSSPVTVYKWALCCHGGPEIGFYAKDFLKSEKTCMRIEFLEVPKEVHALLDPRASQEERALVERIQRSIAGVLEKNNISFKELFRPRTHTDHSAIEIGFLWYDFFADTATDIFGFDQFRGFVLGKELVACLLKRDGVLFVIRGHQHAGWLGDKLVRESGCVALYDYRVHTLVSGIDVFENAPFKYSFLSLSKDERGWCAEHEYENDEFDSDDVCVSASAD